MLLAALDDQTLRKIAVGRLEGLSNAEIAHELGCAVRTVERKLERIPSDLDRGGPRARMNTPGSGPFPIPRASGHRVQNRGPLSGPGTIRKEGEVEARNRANSSGPPGGVSPWARASAIGGGSSTIGATGTRPSGGPGARPGLRDFLEGAEGESRDALWCELVMLDLELRSRGGATPILSEGLGPLPEYPAFLDVSTDQGPSMEVPGSVMPDPTLRKKRRRAPGDSGSLPGMKAPRSRGTSSPRGRVPVDLPSTVGEVEDPAGRKTTSRLPRTCLPRSGPIPKTCRTSMLTGGGDGDGIGAGDPAGRRDSHAPGIEARQVRADRQAGAGGDGRGLQGPPGRPQSDRRAQDDQGRRLATDREIHLFQVEAEAVAALDHPNIVPILEVGEQDGSATTA